MATCFADTSFWIGLSSKRDQHRPKISGLGLQKFAELVWSQTRRTKNGAQGATIQGPVVRHDYLAEWVLTARHNVASLLADYVEARTLQGSDTLPSGYNGEVAHTVTRRASKCSSGTGKLSTSRAPTYAWTASLMLASAASCVSPWVTQPGKLGHSAIQKPSSPR